MRLLRLLRPTTFLPLLLVYSPPALAMEAGMQDDQAVVYGWHDRQLALEQFKRMGGTHVRINVIHRSGPAAGPQDLTEGAESEPLSSYDSAISAVRDVGLTPQLTLVWYGQSDPDDTAAWMRAMAAHFAPVVDRYSVLNEPDLTIPASDDCDARTVRDLVTSGVLQVAYSTVRTKQYLRKRVRVRRRGKVFRAWRPVYTRKPVLIASNGRSYRAWKRVRRYRWISWRVPVSKSGTVTTARESLSLSKGCRAIIRGRRYRAIFQLAAPAIRRADPGAQVLAGETSPVQGLDLFIRQVLPVDADGWAHHPYQWDLQPDSPRRGYGIGDTGRVGALVGMPLYYTEFGYPRPGTDWERARFGGIFTEESVAQATALAWRFAESQGVRQMVQFGWFSPHEDWQGSWDTSLIAGDDGATTPAFEALSLALAR